MDSSLKSNTDPGKKNEDRLKDNHIQCDICGKKPVDIACTIRIQGVPEYMCIHLNLTTTDAEGEPAKNRNPLRIPDILDLTQHIQQVGDRPAAPLRYKLIDVVYHQGDSLNSGHYVAGVTGPESIPDTHQFFVNDIRVHPWSNTAGTSVLTANPAEHNDYYESEYDPHLLFYDYIPNSKGSTKGMTVVPLAADIQDDSSIAERIRKKSVVWKDRGVHNTRKKREKREGAK